MLRNLPNPRLSTKLFSVIRQIVKLANSSSFSSTTMSAAAAAAESKVTECEVNASTCGISAKSSKEKNIKKRQEKKDKRAAKLQAVNAQPPSQKSLLKNIKEELYTSDTIAGEKKDISIKLPDSYSTKFVECFWYDWWVKQDFFKPEFASPMIYERSQIESEKPEPYVILLPPPNVTGKLHLGHALTVSIEDALVRYHRMNGYRALYVPGTDHAGIATQIVVEKRLKRLENKVRTDYSRQEFLEKVLQWKDQYQSSIFDQVRSLATSVDWSRQYFTMNDQIQSAVRRAFIDLYDRKLIYRSNKLVNWSCILQSAISKVEVENILVNGSTNMQVPGYDKTIEFGVLHEFSYELINNNPYSPEYPESKEKINVATTRIETMLGDVAVAVNPNDERFKHLIGRFLRHPFCDRKLKIIADEYVSTDFGTGAVKITPGHDYNDFDMGVRHGLEVVNVLNNDGTIVDGYGEFSGMKRFDARYKIIKNLKEMNLYNGKKSHTQSLPICSRSKDIIEPILKVQWFMKCEQVALRADKCVESGELDIKPDNFKKIWSNWMTNCEDWCISRQLWWGIQIPAYKVSNSEANKDIWVAANCEQEALEKAMNLNPTDFNANCKVIQDEDVLDTWFSSALLPFASVGWPNSIKNNDLADFFPNQILETGSDILFFWVARMVFMSLLLCGKVPFKQVYLHSMVRDAFGRKMSKSLGNVIDPFMVINGIKLQDMHESLKDGNLDTKELDKAKQGQKATYPNGIPVCGSDALRFSLVNFNVSPKDLNLSVQEIVSNRKFCNKIWNAFKFISNHIDMDTFTIVPIKVSGLSPIDIYILSSLHTVINNTHKCFKELRLNDSTDILFDFFISKFCDVYLECSKLSLNDSETPDQSHVFPTKQILLLCMRTFLLLLHPFMPFITEELFQRLPRLQRFSSIDPNLYSICISQYPKFDELAHFYDEELCKMFEQAFALIKSIRNFRHTLNIRKEPTKIYVSIFGANNVNTPELASSYHKYIEYIDFLTKSSVSIIEKDSSDLKDLESDHKTVSKDFQFYKIFLKLPEQFDSSEFCEKTDAQIKKLVSSKEKLLETKHIEDDSLSNNKKLILEEKTKKLDDEIESLRILLNNLKQ